MDYNQKKELLKLCKQQLLEKELVNNLLLPDLYKYGKILNIAYYMPYKVYNTNNDYLKHQYCNYYGSMMRSYLINPFTQFEPIQTQLYKMMYKDLIDEKMLNDDESEIIKGLISFCENNCKIMYLYKDFYDTKDNEIKNFNNGDHNYKTIGKVGEYLIMDYLQKNNLNPYHVAKELGNGFGYDIFFNTFYDALKKYNGAHKIENLTEIKATCKYNVHESEDNFILTFNEADKMLDTLNNDEAKYNVYRIFLNSNLFYPLDAYNDLSLRFDNYCYFRDGIAKNKDGKEIGYNYVLEKRKNYTQGITF